MTIGLLATGDELIHGDTLNTNGHQIAHALSSEGLPLGFHLTCSDKKSDIIRGLDFLSSAHDIIILIGGLGPTTDDLTRFALGEFTNDPLVEHIIAVDHIKKRLQVAQVPINQGNLQQALFPESAKILPNPNGSAVGCQYEWQNKTFFLLPGPPRECLPMFEDYVLPVLQKTAHSEKHIVKWRIFGVAESEIAQILEDALAHLDCQTGYRLDTPYIEFKVRCKQELIDEVTAIVDPILAPHIISNTEQKASDKLRSLLASIQEPIIIIDEATEGALQTLLMKPGIKNQVYFHEVDDCSLYFHLSGLEAYWNNEQPKGQSQLVIHYRNQTQEGGETHQIPYRSPLIIHYAVEWLCFRLFHLINQLHQRVA